MLRLFALASMALAGASGCLVVNDFDDLRGGGGAGDGPVTAGAPNPCAAGLVREVCGPDRKCTLTSPGTGVAGGIQCGPSGNKQAWAACDNDAQCPDGAWCDQYTSTCKPWCATAAECPAKAACIDARRPDRTPVPGLTVCTAHCDLQNPSVPCGPGVNCVIDDLDAPEADCFKAGTIEAGCQPDPNVGELCARGLRLDSDGVCKEWCFTGDDTSCDGMVDIECQDRTLVVFDDKDFALCIPTACAATPGGR